MFEDERFTSDYWWCLHCERVYHVDKWIKNDFWCPGEDCDGGGAGIDAFPWSEKDGFPRRAHSEYPSVPVEGELYPLY